MNKALVPVLTLLLLAPSLAFAAASEAEKEAACQGDAMRLCQEFVPDRDKITVCMRQKTVQLSPACRAIFAEEAGEKGKAK